MSVIMKIGELKAFVLEANLSLYRAGLAPLTWGNVSGVNRELGVLAIKPSGVPYDKMKVDDIALVSLEDGAHMEGLKPSSDTPTHIALCRAFPAIGGVAHTHSTYATAFAQAGRPIPCLGTTHADNFLGDVPVTLPLLDSAIAGAYEHETGVAIIDAFSGRDPMDTPAALVRSHGPFTWGKDAMDAVGNAQVLEEVAKMAAFTFLIDGAPARYMRDDALYSKHHSRKHGAHAYYGQKTVKN